MRKARHGEGGGKLTILLHYLWWWSKCEREGKTEETEAETYRRMQRGPKSNLGNTLCVFVYIL